MNSSLTTVRKSDRKRKLIHTYDEEYQTNNLPFYRDKKRRISETKIKLNKQRSTNMIRIINKKYKQKTIF